jgi:predicted ATPase/DNA-binding SARP family transcriptional activator
MRVELLGTVQVCDDAGAPAHVGGPRARALLALLALDADRVVPAASLIDRLWDGEAPEGARSALQSMISRLRGVLGEAIESHPAGYRLAVDRGRVDAVAFEELAGRGSRALAGGDTARASAILREALALWRGPALSGLPATGPVAGIAARLEELRRSATADRIEADLAAADASDAAGLTAELRALVAEDPLAERPRALLMRALYLADRQADALAVYADARAQLAAQLGVDPSPQLEQVYLGVLRRSLPEARSPAGVGRQARSDPAVSGPAAAAPAGLRVPLTSLVGRDDQVAQVEALTSENRLVTLTGPGGVGKTRLAAEVASRAATLARGGVWLVDVAPLTDPHDVPYAALTATGIRDRLLGGSGGSGAGQTAEPGASTAADPSRRLVSGLRERSGLIVLDNCEHLIDAVAGLADTVLSGCPGIRVLATSREALGITGETVCPVPPLPVPPACGDGELAAVAAAASVRLLADRARAVRPGFAVTDANAADLATICRVLDGMPLAIELAAARLRTMSPAQLTGRLGDRFAVLTGGSRTALPRHQTLRAVVEWSWELLSKPERVLARRMAALPEGATLGAAEGICSDEPGELSGELPAGAVLDALTGLADKSFLTVHGEVDDREPRYRMLDTIRAYCLERLAEAAEEDGVRDRMCGYYLTLAETAEPLLRTRAQLHWLGVLAAESDNVHAAFRWAIERRDVGTALRFGAALAWYWYLSGQLGDGAALAKAALALDAVGQQRTDRATAEARAICAVAVAESANWDLEVAREPLDAAAAAAAADPGGRPLHPVVMIGLVQAARFAGDVDRWLQLLADYHDSADPWVGAMARLYRAALELTIGRVGEASHDCDAALTLFRDTGEIWGTILALTFRAEMDQVAGDYRGAIAALEEAVALDQQFTEASEDLSWLYQVLAGLRIRTGDYAAAHAVLDLASRNAWAQADAGPYLRLTRAELAWREGDLAEATRLCEDLLRGEADRLAVRAPVRALAGARLGVLKIEAGDIAPGTALLRDALGEAEAAGDRPAGAAAVEGLAVAALRTAGAERAAALLGAADSIRGAVDHGSLDAPVIRAAAREQLGEAAFDAAYQRGLGMPYDEALGFAQLLCPCGCGRRKRRRLLRPDVGPAEHQVRDVPDGQRHQDAEVGEGPGSGLAAQAERPEQVTLPGQPARRRVGHQAPADRRGDHDGRDRRPPDVAVSAGRVEELGLGVVAPAQPDVGQHDPAPGRDRNAERDQEALELADEVVREEHHVDGAQRHHRAVDRGGRVPGNPDAEREHGQPRGVDVEHGATDQPEHRHDGERHEEPGRQQRGQRPDRVGADRRA